ncbi:MAG: alpha-ketoglutarate-dependent dioxygenase AlkB [Variovorax sp.]|nr:MAG: alpha-ketoglutarate-dependent dioxygenase AlkB [Variovorax sp.]
MTQGELFGDGRHEAAPEGWAYEPRFLSAAEEAGLITWIERLPLAPMRYKQYVARRRGLSFGGHYDFDANRLVPSPPMPQELAPLVEKAAAWLGRAPESFIHALIAEYRPGTPLGWHRDVPDFEEVVGVSLAGEGEMEFRRYPPRSLRNDPLGGRLRIAIEPRSIYRIAGPARWEWQHAVVPSPTLRYSITLRTARAAHR